MRTDGPNNIRHVMLPKAGVCIIRIVPTLSTGRQNQRRLRMCLSHIPL